MKKNSFDAIEFAAKAHRGQYRKGNQNPLSYSPPEGLEEL